MSVSAYALTSVAEVLTFLGEDAYSNAFWIYFSGTTGINTCQINEDSVVLIDEDNGTTTIDITHADYDTLAELIAKINTVTGWNAGLLYNGSADSGDLRITGALDCDTSSKQKNIQIKDVYKIERLIDRATDFIERYCNRLLASRTHTKEVYDSNAMGELILEQYPATQVQRVGLGRENVFSIKYTTACTSAFVEVDSTNVILTVDGVETEVAISTNTMNQLITAIELNAGWECTLLNSNFGSYQASEILIFPGSFCKDPDFAYMEIVDDYLSIFYLKKGTSESRNPGILYYRGGFPGGLQNIFVTYVAGYTTIPAALEEACIRLVSLRYGQSERADSGDLKKETLGDYSYEKFDLADMKNAWPPELQLEIDLFKKHMI